MSWIQKLFSSKNQQKKEIIISVKYEYIKPVTTKTTSSYISQSKNEDDCENSLLNICNPINQMNIDNSIIHNTLLSTDNDSHDGQSDYSSDNDSGSGSSDSGSGSSDSGS